MKTAFLICALALPCLPKTNQERYTMLWEYLERKFPEYHIVLVHEDEKLLNPTADPSPVTMMPRNKMGHKGLRIWTVKKSA